MLNNNQLEYLISLEEARLVEYLNNRSYEELINIKLDLKLRINSQNGLSKDDTEKCLTTLSYVEAELNGLAQTENKNAELDFELIDTSQFKPLTSADLIRILGLTIKKDEENKLLTFLCMLSAFTENSQTNISFNAPSSSGKSFIPIEISSLFPSEDTIKLGTCSPSAFFHEQGIYDKKNNIITVDLSRKILIFLDQPNNKLLERLRSLLSHDEKEIQSKITDKNNKGGNRTKTVIIKGFPSVIFCTAGLNLDEQEATRCFLLSPQIDQEKIRQGILERIKRDTDNSSYNEYLNSNEERNLLKKRIIAIRDMLVTDIKIQSSEIIQKKFFERIQKPKPRHQRDIGRVISLIKVFTLLNLWFRKRDNRTVYASEDDINEAFKLWDVISESQELGIPPFVHNLYKEVIIPAFIKKNNENETKVGLTRQEIVKNYYEARGTYLPDWQLRQWILPTLETAGLISQEHDQFDKRKILIYPIIQLTISNKENNSE